MSENQDAGEREFGKIQTLHRLIWLMGGGLAGVAFYAVQFWSIREFASVASAGILIAGASALGGALVGFLFGIPRTLQEGRPAEPQGGNGHAEGSAAGGGQKGGAGAGGADYRTNTSLEQISDWLTKILVGVGLTQIASLPGRIQALSEYAAKGLGDCEGAAAMAGATMIYYSVCGFLFAYLWTRLFLTGELRRAALEAVAIQTDELVQWQRKEMNDALANEEVNRLLYSDARIEDDTVAKLAEALGKATREAKRRIYWKARQLRAENWEADDRKPRMARTIPVFRALIQDDTGNLYHANHGQLGFALKDQKIPAWPEAEAELTRAIEMRGRWEKYGWLAYEFNRAICRIQREQEAAPGKPSSPESKKKILEDLRAACQSDWKLIVDEDATIGQWRKRNKVTPRMLHTWPTADADA